MFTAHAPRLTDSAAHGLMGDRSINGEGKKSEGGENGRTVGTRRESKEGGKSGFPITRPEDSSY